MSNTYVQIVQSRPVLSSVIDDQELDTTPEKLLGRIDVQAIEGTELVRITAEGESPEEASDLADALARAFVAEGIATTDGVGQTLEHLKIVGANVLGLVYNEAAER